MAGIKPGVYRLLDSTGRELWSAALTERHLVWRWAHPGMAIPMAAADADQRPKMATLQASLLDGRLQVCVSAALESGHIELSLRPASGLFSSRQPGHSPPPCGGKP